MYQYDDDHKPMTTSEKKLKLEEFIHRLKNVSESTKDRALNECMEIFRECNEIPAMVSASEDGNGILAVYVFVAVFVTLIFTDDGGTVSIKNMKEKQPIYSEKMRGGRIPLFISGYISHKVKNG